MQPSATSAAIFIESTEKVPMIVGSATSLSDDPPSSSRAFSSCHVSESEDPSDNRQSTPGRTYPGIKAFDPYASFCCCSVLLLQPELN